MNNFEDSENSTDEHENDSKNLENEENVIMNSLSFNQSKDNELVKTDLSSRKKHNNAVKFNSAALILKSSLNSLIKKFKKDKLSTVSQLLKELKEFKELKNVKRFKLLKSLKLSKFLQKCKFYTSVKMKSYIQKVIKKSLADVRIIWDNLKILKLNLTDYLRLETIIDLRNFLETNSKITKIMKRFIESQEQWFDLTKDMKNVLQSTLWNFIMNKVLLILRELNRSLLLSMSWYSDSEKRSIVSWLVIMFQLIQTALKAFSDLDNVTIIKHLRNISEKDWHKAYYIIRCFWKCCNDSRKMKAIESILKLQNKSMHLSLYLTNINLHDVAKIEVLELIMININLFNQEKSQISMNNIEFLNELLNFEVLSKNEKIKCIAVINDVFEKFFYKVLSDLRKIDVNNVQSSMSENVQMKLIAAMIKKVKIKLLFLFKMMMILKNCNIKQQKRFVKEFINMKKKKT